MKWTDGRIRGFITSTIRSGFRRWPEKYTALDRAKVGKIKNKQTGRLAEHYRCASCNGNFISKDVQVDHIDPVVPLTGFTTWDNFIERMFCDSEKLQVLCIKCHKDKTKKESELRKNLRGKK